MLEPSPSVPFRTVESPMIHSVGNAGFAGTGGKYLPLRGTSLIWIEAEAVCSSAPEVTYFSEAVSTAFPFSESRARSGLPGKALRPDTIDDAMNSAPGRYVWL